MLNILEKKQNTFDYKSLDTTIKKENKVLFRENYNIQNKQAKNEYNNIIYYTYSTKEWFSSVYSYNKSYVKALISLDILVNYLLKSYINMLEDKVKVPFKRRRTNKVRYSADKIYASRAELKHTSTKLTVMLYIYNKQKFSIIRYMNKLLTSKSLFNVVLGKRKYKKEYKSRLYSSLKNTYFFFNKWTNIFFKKSNNYLQKVVNLKRRDYKAYGVYLEYFALANKFYRLEQTIFNAVKSMNFNLLKFNFLQLNFEGLGLISLLEKIYAKKIVIKFIELKSLHLNSDVFSSAVALKLRDRKNKATNILRKAVQQMVKIPDLHTIRTFDDRVGSFNKNSILNVIKQQVVSGVRFEASGRLTRRLTAMRAVFKYRYMGSLQNLRSTLNRKPSTILRGYVKSNSQYTIINSKTRNGAFGLKGWVSSH